MRKKKKKFLPLAERCWKISKIQSSGRTGKVVEAAAVGVVDVGVVIFFNGEM
jgi:hypothetical protein